MVLLSHFSSFLEIVTGIYISMCMDDVLKGIWSPKYYDDLKKALTDYYLNDHDDLINRIVETNEEKAKSIKSYMKHRAAYFFITCIVLLFLSGFEESVTDVNSLQMSMMFLSLWSLVLIAFNKYFFSSNPHTAAAVALSLILTALSYLINNQWLHWLVPDIIIVPLVLTVLISPILWQAFVCWMFSSSYKGYIRTKLARGKECYELAEKGLNEHKPEIIPKKYIEIYNEESIRSDNAEDAKKRCLDYYLEQMEDEITEASNPHSVFKIFLSWIFFHVSTGFFRFAIWIHLKDDKTISQQQQ